MTLLTSGPLVIVTRPDLPANNVRELIALAKSTPGKLTFASSGNGQSTHLAAELFGAMAGVRMVHAVSYTHLDVYKRQSTWHSWIWP